MATGEFPPKIVFYGLESSLLGELKGALQDLQLPADSFVSPHNEADLVFCPVDVDVFHRALEQYCGTPVVVVSRLPEVEAWLNALEDGAADYCAAPFEPVQMRWLLQTHLAKHFGAPEPPVRTARAAA